jgi:nucleoside phosphorylase
LLFHLTKSSISLNDITITDPCILFAIHREAQGFLREFRPQQRFPGAPCWAKFCGPEWLTVLVLETGVGSDQAQKALDWVLSKPVFGNLPYEPKVIISAGFAGALHNELHIGDLILANEVIDSEGKTWPVPWPGSLPDGDWQPPLKRGRLLTTSHFVAAAEKKRNLGNQHHALAVDMESATIASICSRNQIPFGCVRAISDAIDTPVSVEVMTVLEGAAVSWAQLALLLARSPRKAAELWRLAKATKFAGENLAKALGELLTLTLSWGADL